MFPTRLKLISLLSVLLFKAGMLGAAFPVLCSTEHSVAVNELRWQNSDTIRVCALRVEFQPDAVTGTSGNGLMADSSIFPDSLRIDGLPHDAAYFADHLEFVRNYYRAVSHDRLAFADPVILPAEPAAPLRMNYPMWHYNFNTNQELLNQKLVELFVHAIWKADSAGLPLSQYNAFVIFHAGIGKDFSIGFDNTPFDIPSAYISAADLLPYRASLPAAVTRGIILPEGENQNETLEFGIELSLNGIAVKLFGNWLGLPDLFNTRTGASGVGRWGMMDQGSGNINALVPALPDAWSRVYMDWVTPHVIIPGGDTAVANTTYSLARFGIAGASEVIKIPLTPREYYLIENRDADADSLREVTLYDREGRQYRVDRFADIVFRDPEFRTAVRASHYDFGIPGSGILVWHIDEDVIEANLETNSVNADIDHRGVDLVEADGPQDIGREFGFASAGSGTELGIQEDAWWNGNRDHRDANNNAVIRFTDRSHPSAKLYDGASTFLELTNFSDVAATMTFRARITTTLPGFPVSFPQNSEWRSADLLGDGVKELYFISEDSLISVSREGERSTLFALRHNTYFGAGRTASDLDGDGADELLFASAGYTGYLTRHDETGQLDSVIWTEWGSLPPVARMYPARTISGAPKVLYVGCYTGTCEDPGPFVVFRGFEDPHPLGVDVTFETRIAPLSIYNVESLPASTFLLVRLGEAACVQALDTEAVELWHINDSRILGTAQILAYPDRRVAYLEGYGYVDAYSGDLMCAASDCNPPAVDWNGDGTPGGGGELVSAQSVGEEDFPHFDAKQFHRFKDLDASGDPDVIILDARQDSANASQSHSHRIHALQHGGQRFEDFPIATPGVTLDGTALSLDSTNTLYYVAEFEDNGQFYYALNRLPVAVGNRARFPYEESVAIINIGPLRPQVNAREDWVYCWPNPASSVSHIRVTRSAASTATATIFDLAGRKVAHLSGGLSMPGAYELDWYVSDVESGVYIGRVEVTGGGASDSREIKIAVVR